MHILIAKLKTKPGQENNLIKLAEKVIGPSRAEEGCIKYEFYQDPSDREAFMFFEIWRSREDLELHFKEPHFLEFAGESQKITEGAPNLVWYEVTGEEKIA